MSVDEVLRRLSRYDTCTLSDALESVGVPGALATPRRITTNARVAGVALTVQLAPWDGVTSSHHLGTKAIEAASDQTVIVVAGGSSECACWGGLLASAAAAKGVRGVVADGYVRDVDEAAALGFPMFAAGTTPVTARGRLKEVSWGQPVSIDGVTVSSGDFVLADGSGVVVMPSDVAGKVLDAAATIFEREAAMRERIERGEAPSSVLNRSYETMVGGGDR